MRNKIIFGLIIFILFFLINVNNINDEAKAAGVTLGQYEQKLRDFKIQAENNKKAINKTQSEITNTNNRVESLKTETLKLVAEIKILNEEIDDFKNKIKERITDTKHVLEYMQMIDGDNIYFNYVLKADSVSDIINREMVIKQLVEYNKKSINEMEVIIDGNKERQGKIDKRQAEINNKEKELEKNITILGDKKASLLEGGVSIEKQIKIYDELVTGYKKAGCKTNHVIGVDCARSDSGIFRRPTQTGYVTQEQYYGSSYSHRGMDISSSKKSNEKIFPVADGRISAKYVDGWGAYTVVIEHYNAAQGKYYSSLYAHLSSFAPNTSVGTRVTSNQYIGYMGTTGKSTGIHLHMEVFPCRLYNFSDGNCNTWDNYYNFTIRQLRNGYNVRNIITFPKGLYNSWSSR